MNRLSFDKTERTQARHLKKALQLPTAAESCCSPFTISDLDIAIHAMRRKGAAGPDDIPPTFLKALDPMAKAGLLSNFNESFSKRRCARNLEGSDHSPVEKDRPTTRGYLLLPTCQPHILYFQDNRKNGAQPLIQLSRGKRMALQRTGWLRQASVLRGPNS